MSASGEVIYIIDDEAGMRRALTRLLRAEGYVVRAFASAREFLAEDHHKGVACLLLDVAMPDLNVLDLQRQLTQAGILMPIVFLTGTGDIPMSVQAIKSGAVDFLTKPVNDADLLRAVRAALERAGEQRSEIAEAALLGERLAKLTPRELEVMRHVVTGKLNKQIAAELGTGEQNIKIHRGRVMEKMEVESLADLVRAAARLGLDRKTVL